MAMQVTCDCGATIPVTATQAGRSIRCGCGRTLPVPSLRVLQGLEEDPAARNRLNVSGEEKNWKTDSTGRNTSRREEGDLSEGERPLLPITILLHSDAEVRERIDAEALTHFVTAFHRSMEDFFEDQPSSSPAAIQVACALLPEGRRLLEVQWEPNGETIPIRRQLHNRLAALAVPMVRGRPVAFAVRLVRGNLTSADPPFRLGHPFRTLYRGRSPRSLDELLMTAAGLEGDGENGGSRIRGALRTCWERLRGLVRRSFASSRSLSRAAGERPLRGAGFSEGLGADADDAVPPEVFHLLEDSEVTESQLSAALAQFPRCAALLDRRAKLRARDQRWDAAVEDVTRFLELRPDDLDALVLRG